MQIAEIVRLFGKPLMVLIGGYHVPMPTQAQLDAAKLQDNERVYDRTQSTQKGSE